MFYINPGLAMSNCSFGAQKRTRVHYLTKSKAIKK